ncbi:hypothetical protein BH24ACT11_BH24ACT11_11650 [soil metagenome]
MITAGTTHGMTLALQHLWAPGGHRGHRRPRLSGRGSSRRALRLGGLGRAGRRPGLRVDRLGAAPTSTRAYYVTASHQHPLGGLLPVPRRLELLAEATRRDAVVFEDDYDSEFRYDVAPLPALAQLDPARVIYLGTVAKTLGAGMRLGWLVAPAELIAELAERRRWVHDHPPWPLQRALLCLLRDGEWDRLARQAKRRYRHRANQVQERLGAYGRLLGLEAGMHATLLLPTKVAADAAADAAAGRGRRAFARWTRPQRRPDFRR